LSPVVKEMIRKFEITDLDAILRIEAESFPKLPYDRRTFRYYARAYPDQFLVYVTGPKSVVGYIIFYPQGHIVSLAVHRAYRRRGIGTELVAAVLKRTGGSALVEVRRSNMAAQRFYTQLGFKLRGVIPRYYGDEDALVMVHG
jgi:ribosomal-protein-alanine N-acetyltransferase